MLNLDPAKFVFIDNDVVISTTKNKTWNWFGNSRQSETLVNREKFEAADVDKVIVLSYFQH